MQSILYHNQSGAAAFTGNLKTREVHRAITLHPIKKPAYMYRLHNYFRELKVQGLKQASVELHREIRRAQTCLGDQMELVAEDVALQITPPGSPDNLGDTYLLGTPAGLTRHQPDNLDDLLHWDFLTKSLYSAADSNPRRRIDSALKEGTEDVIREIMETINMYSKQRGRVIDFREVLYAYTRVDPLHGVDWVLDLLLVYRKYRGHKMTVPVRRHAYVQQTFTGMEIREIPLHDDDTMKEIVPHPGAILTDDQHIGHKIHRVFYESFRNIKNLNILPSFLSLDDKMTNFNPITNKVINFILPLSGRYETFQRFMSCYEDICLKNNEAVKLIVILYLNSAYAGDYNRTIRLINGIHERYPRSSRINVVEMLHRPFSRGEALQIGVSQCYMNDLLFFVDVDMIFNSESLLRIRLNTVRNRQANFPIVFSEYDPAFANTDDLRPVVDCETSANHTVNPKIYGANNFSDNLNVEHNFVIHDNKGYWRLFGFGIASVYRCDFETVGGFNTSIQGWGLEDVSLFEKLVKSHLKVFRSPDTSLVHVFHHIDCSPELSEAQRQMCSGSRANTLSSVQTLYQFIRTNPKLLEYMQFRNMRKPGT